MEVNLRDFSPGCNTKQKLLATHFCRVTQGIVCVFCAGGGYLTVPYQMCVFTDGFG